jgi:multisubunit Na+/H+ antiporter MnhB subunit
VLGIIGFVLLLVCGAWVAILGFAFSIDAPHAWKGDARDGLMLGLIALALIVPGIFLLRSSIRRLRSLRKIRIPEPAIRPKSSAQ